jgi:hypothetical protein
VEGAAVDWVAIRRAAPATSVKDNAALMDFEFMDIFMYSYSQVDLAGYPQSHE